MFCPKCGANAGDANFCPNCGYNLGDVPVDLMHTQQTTQQPTTRIPRPAPKPPKQKKSKGWIPIFIVLVIILAIIIGIIALVSGCAATVANQFGGNSFVPTSSTPGIISSNSDASREKPAALGTAVSNEKVSIKINSVSEVSKIEDETGLTYYQPSSGAKFVVINLTAKNVGKEMYSFLCNNFQIKSKDGNQYSPSLMMAKDYLNSGTINPGLSETGNIAYDVPQSLKASDLTLEFQEFLSINKAQFALSGTTKTAATSTSHQAASPKKSERSHSVAPKPETPKRAASAVTSAKAAEMRAEAKDEAAEPGQADGYTDGYNNTKNAHYKMSYSTQSGMPQIYYEAYNKCYNEAYNTGFQAGKQATNSEPNLPSGWTTSVDENGDHIYTYDINPNVSAGSR